MCSVSSTLPPEGARFSLRVKSRTLALHAGAELEAELDDEDYEGIEDFDDLDDDLLDEFLADTDMDPLAAAKKTHAEGEEGSESD